MPTRARALCREPSCNFCRAPGFRQGREWFFWSAWAPSEEAVFVGGHKPASTKPGNGSFVLSIYRPARDGERVEGDLGHQASGTESSGLHPPLRPSPFECSLDFNFVFFFPAASSFLALTDVSEARRNVKRDLKRKNMSAWVVYILVPHSEGSL